LNDELHAALSPRRDLGQQFVFQGRARPPPRGPVDTQYSPPRLSDLAVLSPWRQLDEKIFCLAAIVVSAVLVRQTGLARSMCCSVCITGRTPRIRSRSSTPFSREWRS
jgi:hypothetical protein